MSAAGATRAVALPPRPATGDRVAVPALLLAAAVGALAAQEPRLALAGTGGAVLIAVAVLFSVSYWLISKVEAAKWQQFIREKVSTA